METQKLKGKNHLIRDTIMTEIAKKKRKNIEPAKCMKFIQIDMNDEIMKNFDFYQETVIMLQCSSAIHSINSSSLIPNNTITWTRIIEEYSIDNENKINTTIKKVREKNILIIWKWDQVVKQIYEKTFKASIARITDSMSQMTFTLIIYGIERYFKYYKCQNNHKNNISYTSIEMNGIPKISSKDFELSLVDIQIDNNFDVRLIENSSDMSLLIYQYTKAIAEKTYELETKNRLYDQMDFFSAGDNKKTIKVDNDGYGLKKLWLKQLCMFNTSNLGTADAIYSKYSSPNELIIAYMNDSYTEDGDLLLKNIEIPKMAAGPLAKMRKLGPELSRKIHVMFSSVTEDQLLD